MNGGIKNIEVNYIEPLTLYSNIKFVIHYSNRIERILYYISEDNLFGYYRLYMCDLLIDVDGVIVDGIDIIRHSYIFNILDINLCDFSELLLGYCIHPTILVAKNIEDIQKILVGIKYYNEF